MLCISCRVNQALHTQYVCGTCAKENQKSPAVCYERGCTQPRVFGEYCVVHVLQHKQVQCHNCGHIGTNVAADASQCLQCCDDWDDDWNDWDDWEKEPQDCDDGDARRQREEEDWMCSPEGMIETAGYYDGLNARLPNFPFGDDPNYNDGYAAGAENAHLLRTNPELSHGPMDESATPY